MANLTWHQPSSSKSVGSSLDCCLSAQESIRHLVMQMAVATLVLMAIGSATRVMNAGLACPDWPLCYGVLVPRQQMNIQVFLEWFHRLDASLIGVMAIGLAVRCWWQRHHLPQWTPWLATVALGLVVVQGLLGGLTVTELLRFDIVTAHLGTAQLFFTVLVVMAITLIPYQGTGTVGKLPWVALLSTLSVYLQSLSGGLVASRWALHQCFAQGELCVVMNAHVMGVAVPTVLTVTMVVLAHRTPALHPLLRRLATLAGVVLVLQVLLGVATFYLRLQVELLTVSHHTIGAMLLGILTAFTGLSLRDRIQAKGMAI
ncbi:MAG: COX15/CtaA family protein [Cyanobacteria bacterium]|nr:COX15/CtaA family protein [Cyanobacteriota bacterium]MDW8200441.1 COX15/CtaA family protein [Cyanobacteriota bacterium SKYGB_h_bin112]